jgi:hypothetical protein
MVGTKYDPVFEQYPDMLYLVRLSMAGDVAHCVVKEIPSRFINTSYKTHLGTYVKQSSLMVPVTRTQEWEPTRYTYCLGEAQIEAATEMLRTELLEAVDQLQKKAAMFSQNLHRELKVYRNEYWV